VNNVRILFRVQTQRNKHLITLVGLVCVRGITRPKFTKLFLSFINLRLIIETVTFESQILERVCLFLHETGWENHVRYMY
jgi:hypothetical protein